MDGNVHEIAQAVDPAARVVYIDVDPVAVAHGEMILADNPNARAAQADLRDPDTILGLPAVRDLIGVPGTRPRLGRPRPRVLSTATRPARHLRRRPPVRPRRRGHHRRGERGSPRDRA